MSPVGNNVCLDLKYVMKKIKFKISGMMWGG